jgi:D-ala D-ala ligase C-terminus
LLQRQHIQPRHCNKALETTLPLPLSISKHYQAVNNGFRRPNLQTHSNPLPSPATTSNKWYQQTHETRRSHSPLPLHLSPSNLVLGYQDSGADIAYTLSLLPSLQILTPKPSPSPVSASDWCFPDTEFGILSALTQGATHLWANTILFSSHPLQKSALLDPYQDKIQIVGQPPNLVEKFDDKECVNNLLRKTGKFTLPRGWSICKSSSGESIGEKLKEMQLPYPVVGKPIRGRGSYGVKVCSSLSALETHIGGLLKESPEVMIEEFLAGEEATVTVMPPGHGRDEYWALPIVTRFNHADGVAPWNGIVAVTANSRVVSKEEYEKDARYGEVAKECEGVARLLKGTAPIRIDIRRFRDGPGEKFALFDVNMKPVS